MHSGGAVGFDYPELRRLHGGGGLLPDERFIIGQTGEWMMQRPAVDYYGPAFMQAVNERRLPRSGGGSAPVFNVSVDVQGSNASPRDIAKAIRLELKRASDAGEIIAFSGGVANRDWNNA